MDAATSPFSVIDKFERMLGVYNYLSADPKDKIAYQADENGKCDYFFVSARPYIIGSICPTKISDTIQAFTRFFQGQKTVFVANEMRKAVPESKDDWNILLTGINEGMHYQSEELNKKLISLKTTIKTFEAGISVVLGGFSEPNYKKNELEDGSKKLISELNEILEKVSEEIARIELKMDVDKELVKSDERQSDYGPQVVAYGEMKEQVEGDDGLKEFLNRYDMNSSILDASKLN